MRRAEADHGDIDRRDDRIALPAEQPDRRRHERQHRRREAERDDEAGLVAELAVEEVVDLEADRPGADHEGEAEEDAGEDQQKVHVFSPVSVSNCQGQAIASPVQGSSPKPQTCIDLSALQPITAEVVGFDVDTGAGDF